VALGLEAPRINALVCQVPLLSSSGLVDLVPTQAHFSMVTNIGVVVVLRSLVKHLIRTSVL
jgi:hypothetical protein